LVLQEEIAETFSNRHTPPEKQPIVFKETFRNDPTRQQDWRLLSGITA